MSIIRYYPETPADFAVLSIEVGTEKSLLFFNQYTNCVELTDTFDNSEWVEIPQEVLLGLFEYLKEVYDGK